MRAISFVLPAALALAVIPLSARADDNAALRRLGTAIDVTCDHSKPLNARWHKPEAMLKEKRPAGPIINDLATAKITVTLPVPMHVTQVGLMQADYKRSFAMAKEVLVKAPGRPAKSFILQQTTGKVQFIPYEAHTDTIIIEAQSIYPPRDPKAPQDRPYGGINQVQVLVSEDLDELFRIPDLYARGLSSYTMRTPNLDPQAAAEVQGEPRKATGHPRTIWDERDIARLKEQIETYPAGQEAYEEIIKFCEDAIADELSVPDEPDKGNNPKVASRHQKVALAIGNLGIGYALSDNEKYAAEAKRLLLGLADRYKDWPVHGHPKFTHDKSKWSWQRLNDSIWLIPSAWGYDLIHNSETLTDAERKRIEEDFVMACARFIVRGSSGSLRAPTNWSAIMCAAAMVASRACGDEDLYRKTLYGKRGTDKDNVSGGVYFYIDNAIDDDGMWAEGAIGYQFMAMRGMLVMAETLWRDGIDVYSYNNNRLKLIFDSPIWFAYPGGQNSPAVHDSGGASLFNRDSHLYQYAKRRYGDSTYNAILRKVSPSLETRYNLFLPACDFSPVRTGSLPEVPSVLFPGVGFAIGRTGAGDDSKYLFMDYGPNRSHGHPDKLNFNLFALGQELFADAGSAWYSTDIYQRYYSHSLAHNTVTGNGLSQVMTGGELQTYGSLGDMALIRGSCDSAIPGAALDRTLLMSGNRLYDVYMVKSGLPLTFELPYHSHGKMVQDLATEPWEDHPKDKPGYAYFEDPVAARVDDDWQCSWQVDKGRLDMHFIGEEGSRVIFAKTPKGGFTLPTAMVRRKTADTVYGCAMDIVPDGQDASLALLRRVADGRKGYMLIGEPADGGREMLMVNFTDQPLAFGEWSTDARVAFVGTRAGRIRRFYLAGGTAVEGPGVSIRSESPSLLAYREVREGLAHFANQEGQAASVEISGLTAPETVYALNRDGARADAVEAEVSAGTVRFRLAARSDYELVRGEQPTVAEHEQAIRRRKARAMIERERQQIERARQELASRRQKAKASGMPRDHHILIQAEDFSAQGGGEVRVTGGKTATYGDAFLGWDNPGHWLEYQFETKHEGHYKIIWKYCREGGPVTRSLRLDGAYPEKAFREIEVQGTGGWARNIDHWEYLPMPWPHLEDQPYLFHLTEGKHTLRVENVSGGGVNLDYILLAAPEMKVTREAVEK